MQLVCGVSSSTFASSSDLLQVVFILELLNPLLRALGGSGSVEEIYDKVIELERLPDDVVSQPHDTEKSNQTEVGYRLAWARTYLKNMVFLRIPVGAYGR
jgi:hypothetical protein